jgi:hypothetical protein
MEPVNGKMDLKIGLDRESIALWRITVREPI